MSTNFTCDTVNSLFLKESGRFAVDIHERYTQNSIWGRLVRVGKWPQQMGTSISEITIERIMTGSVEDDWASIANSAGGVVSNGCLPAPVDLQFGETVRTWGLSTKSYRTPCICLDDLKNNFQIASQVGKTITNLTKTTQNVLDNRRRSSYVGFVPKMSVGIGGLVTTFSAIDVTLPPPTYQLSQDLLDRLRIMMIRNGSGEDSLGKENGNPVLGLITSGETSRQLLRNNTELRNDLRYATPSELVAPLGVTRSFGGYYHMEDVEIARYDYITGTGGNPWVRRYPWVQSATTSGYTWELNPLYETAQFEMSVIFHPNVYEECPQQVGPNIPDAPYADFPHFYSGQFFWLNIISEINPLGKIGRWMSVFQSGNRPINPSLGMAIMHRRCPSDFNYTACTNYD